MQVDEEVLSRTVERFRDRKILLPTFAQIADPSSVPEKIRRRLKSVGLWDLDPANLFRITWKNEPIESGGLFNQGNWIEFPPELTGVQTRIIGLLGQFFRQVAQGLCRLRSFGAETCERPSTQRSTKQFGRAPAITAAAELSIQRLSVAPRSRISPEEMSRESLCLAQGYRCGGHCHARLRVERQRNLRQVLGDSPHAARLRDLQPIRGVRQRGLALPCDGQNHWRDLWTNRRRLAARWDMYPPLAAPERLQPATTCARLRRKFALSRQRLSNALRSIN